MFKLHGGGKAPSLLITMLIAFQMLINTGNAAFNYRLDKNIIPESYDIRIKPYLVDEDDGKQFTFDGEVNITLHATVSSLRAITLHMTYALNPADSGSTMRNATLYEADSEKVVQQIDRISIEKETDKVTFQLEQPLATNTNYMLRIYYIGQIRNGMSGVFRASYTDDKGDLKWIVLTQAQRIDARAIVPCFDEPAFKAKFRMRISRPKAYNSVFNTRLINTEIESTDRYLDTFDWTPVMSTYLLAFLISDYVARGDADLAILSRPEYYNYTAFTHEVAKRTVAAYNEYTKLPYKELGNPVLQKASSPQFPHNGMENWGLVLYRDPVLIQEPGYSDGWKDKQYTITILVHETAHMWFGNSVTFAWWSYFWLNEAFARYYQFYLAHELYPEYQLDQQFVTNQVHTIFGTDALNTTQPMTTAERLIETPGQVASKFSAITYAKGASIVRMIRNLMGKNNFDVAVQEYLKEYHLRNTVPDDLFKHLKRHWPTGHVVNLDQFFYDWTEQVGFPVVYVSVEGSSVSVTQKRFLLEPQDGSDANLKYTIPLTYATDFEPNFDNLTRVTYFNPRDEAVNLKLEKPVKWIIFNLQQSNYHRVYYDRTMLNNIREALEQPQHSGIHVINRAQLLDDLFNFGRTGLLDYSEVFTFSEYLAYETEYLPWQAAFTGLQRVAQRLTLAQQKDFRVFILEITAKVYEKLGFANEADTVLDVYNRNNVINWVCKYQDSNCSSEAQAMLEAANSSNVKPSTDFREILYCNAVRLGESKHYEILNDWYKVENKTSEKELLLRSMGCTKNFVDTHYARILTDQIPQEHKRLALKPLYAENPENVDYVFEMVTSTFEQLKEQLGKWSSTADTISDIANYFTTNEQKKSLENFIEENGAQFGSSVATLQRAVQTVENNLQWAETRLGNLVLYLNKRNNAAAQTFSFLLIIFSSIALIFFN